MSRARISFGARTARVEDPALLTGNGRFIDDIALPGTLSAAFVRSPHAHAAINRIDTHAARAIPGVHAVFTLDDLMPHLSSERTPLGQSVREIVGLASRSLRENITPFVLVRDEVCYVGDPIAVVVAESRPIAEDAAQCVEIEFEPLPAVADMRPAIAPDAPPVHRRVAGNILAEYTISYGDCERAFAAAPHRLTLSLFQHRGCAHPMEGRGVLASHDPRERRTTVWTSTQSPHEIRMSLVQLLGLDDEELRIITPDVGGGFGAKYLIYPEEVVALWAAKRVGRPVKWVAERSEAFLAESRATSGALNAVAPLPARSVMFVRTALAMKRNTAAPVASDISVRSGASQAGAPARRGTSRRDGTGSGRAWIKETVARSCATCVRHRAHVTRWPSTAACAVGVSAPSMYAESSACGCCVICLLPY